MKLHCPNCEAQIATEEINVAENLARCLQCGEVFHASDLLEEVSEPEDLTPPQGSRITFQADESEHGGFFIPRCQWNISQLPAIAFALFLAGFLSVWTWGAAQGNSHIAFFSIPFWIIALGMWYGIITSLTQTQEINLHPNKITIRKNPPSRQNRSRSPMQMWMRLIFRN